VRDCVFSQQSLFGVHTEESTDPVEVDDAVVNGLLV